MWSRCETLVILCVGSVVRSDAVHTPPSSSRCLRSPDHKEETTSKAASRTLRFELGSEESDAVDTSKLPCTPRQAVSFGEILDTELEHRTVEPLVTR